MFIYCADSKGEFIGVFETVVRGISGKITGKEIAQKSQMVPLGFMRLLNLYHEIKINIQS